jgi:hypothetical protein
VKQKKAEAMKRYRAVITIEFEAPSREVAMARAKEQFASEHSTVKVQEATTAWLTLVTPSA